MTETLWPMTMVAIEAVLYQCNQCSVYPAVRCRAGICLAIFDIWSAHYCESQVPNSPTRERFLVTRSLLLFAGLVSVCNVSFIPANGKQRIIMGSYRQFNLRRLGMLSSSDELQFCWSPGGFNVFGTLDGL
jgi:hypothetical protein